MWRRDPKTSCGAKTYGEVASFSGGVAAGETINKKSLSVKPLVRLCARNRNPGLREPDGLVARQALADICLYFQYIKNKRGVLLAGTFTLNPA